MKSNNREWLEEDRQISNKKFKDHQEPDVDLGDYEERPKKIKDKKKKKKKKREKTQTIIVISYAERSHGSNSSRI